VPGVRSWGAEITLDVPLLRLDTPGAANVLHFIDVVDSDASGQLDLAALEPPFVNDEAEVERFVRPVTG
jgi:hypothetical protein